MERYKIPGNDLESIEQIMQKCFYPKPDDPSQERVERWELPPVELGANIAQSLTNLGMVNEAFPCYNEYQGGLILGALDSRIQSRIIALHKAIGSGCLLGSVFILTGDRTITLDREKRMLFCPEDGFTIRDDWTWDGKLTENETERFLFRYKQSPISLLFSEPTVIDVPKPKPDDPKSRPDTVATFKGFLAKNPPAGRYLVSTSQPDLHGQAMQIANTCDRDDLEFDYIGLAARSNQKTEYYMRALAGRIHQEYLTTQVPV
jgi:hypothetical protein